MWTTKQIGYDKQGILKLEVNKIHLQVLKSFDAYKKSHACCILYKLSNSTLEQFKVENMSSLSKNKNLKSKFNNDRIFRKTIHKIQCCNANKIKKLQHKYKVIYL